MNKDKMKSSKNVIDARNAQKSLGNKKLTQKASLTKTYEPNNWNPAYSGMMGNKDFNYGRKKDPSPQKISSPVLKKTKRIKKKNG